MPRWNFWNGTKEKAKAAKNWLAKRAPARAFDIVELEVLPVAWGFVCVQLGVPQALGIAAESWGSLAPVGAAFVLILFQRFFGLRGNLAVQEILHKLQVSFGSANDEGGTKYISVGENGTDRKEQKSQHAVVDINKPNAEEEIIQQILQIDKHRSGCNAVMRSALAGINQAPNAVLILTFWHVYSGELAPDGHVKDEIQYRIYVAGLAISWLFHGFADWSANQASVRDRGALYNLIEKMVQSENDYGLFSLTGEGDNLLYRDALAVAKKRIYERGNVDPDKAFKQSVIEEFLGKLKNLSSPAASEFTPLRETKSFTINLAGSSRL